MKRSFDPAELEMMDRPQPVSAELEQDLDNLRQLNRSLGSHALIRHFLRRWISAGDKVRMADLATGSGDIPRMIVDYARKVASRITIDAVDQQSATVAIARKLSAGYPEISYINANILDWKPDEPYDIVFCSLALHHFSDDDAVEVLRHCRELSRKFVLVSDLRRGWLATIGVHILTALIFREAMTKYDGRLSAARAFSFSEFHDLAKRAGWGTFGHRKFRFARQAIWLESTALGKRGQWEGKRRQSLLSTLVNADT